MSEVTLSAQLIPFPRRRSFPHRAVVLALGYAAGFGLLVRDYVVQSRPPEPVPFTRSPTAHPMELAAEP